MPAELTFDAATHTYRVGGVRVPSVTEVLQPLQDFDGVPRAVLDAAAAFGTNAHAACHLDNQGQLDEAALDEALRPYLAAWRLFKDHTDATVVASEYRVRNPKLGYAGTVDVIARVDGREELIDLKTSAEIPRTVGPQTWAYTEALWHENGRRPRRRVVQLRGDGTFRSEVLKDPADQSIFISCLNIWRWRNPPVPRRPQENANAA